MNNHVAVVRIRIPVLCRKGETLLLMCALGNSGLILVAVQSFICRTTEESFELDLEGTIQGSKGKGCHFPRDALFEGHISLDRFGKPKEASLQFHELGVRAFG